MNSVLLATDFSPAAKNAAHVAATIAATHKWKLEVYHCYHYPVPAGDMPFPPVSIKDIEAEVEKMYDTLRDDLNSLHPGLVLETVVEAGLASDDIRKYAEARNNVRMLVMGLTGAGKPGQWLFGSTSLAVARHTQLPVLIVPEDAEWKKLKEVAFATDYRVAENVGGMELMKELVTHDNANVEIINILPEGKLPDAEQSVNGLRLDHYFSGLKHSFHFIEERKVKEGMEEFLQRHPSQLLVMIRRKHGWFQRMISGGNTKKMAYHTHIPLLILHEQ